jgi:hypothetical protein
MVLPFHNFPDWDKTAVSRGESLQLGYLFFKSDEELCVVNMAVLLCVTISCTMHHP